MAGWLLPDPVVFFKRVLVGRLENLVSNCRLGELHPAAGHLEFLGLRSGRRAALTLGWESARGFLPRLRPVDGLRFSGRRRTTGFS